MVSLAVNLVKADNVKTFVQICSKYTFDIDLRSGRYVVDAKSILGIFSLDLSKPVVMEIFSSDCKELLDELKGFIQ